MSGLSLNLKLSHRSASTFLPSDLANLEAWYRFNMGITVTGQGVSTWADQSGNGRDLNQTTDPLRPTKNGDGSISFDDSNDALKAASFSFEQPLTVYLLMKHNSYTSGRYFLDGTTTNSMVIQQFGTSPAIRIYAGTGLGSSSDLVIGTYGVVVAVFNGASSVLQVDDNTPIEGDPGSADPGGIILGAKATEDTAADATYKEAIFFSGAHDANTRAQVRAYLNTL